MTDDLRPGLQFHHYRLLEQIGVGGQGVVWSAEDELRNDIVAIKFNELKDAEERLADDEMFGRQLKNLITIHHPNILPIYDYGLQQQARYLVSPYIAGGSVFDRLRRGPLAVEDALLLSGQIASALDHLHSQGIIHRDVTSSNVLLNLRNHPYLADFGLARTLSNTTKAMHTGRGTPIYAPPEQHKRLEITTQSDIYSFGILLFEIFTGQLPWAGETVLGIRQLYSDVVLPDPCSINPALPPMIKDVLRTATAVEPSERPASAGDVVRMLRRVFPSHDHTPSHEVRDDRSSVRTQDADDLFDQHIDQWSMTEPRHDIGLTKFSLIHIVWKDKTADEIQGRAAHFMLFHSMLYAYHSDYWWDRVSEPHERFLIALALIQRRNESVALRSLEALVSDRSLHLMSSEISSRISSALLNQAFESGNPSFQQGVLTGLRSLLPAQAAWTDAILTERSHTQLGEMALADNETGDLSAVLIGRLCSQTGLNIILEKAGPDRMVTALLDVQQAAGTLPAFVPGRVRRRVLIEWVIQQATSHPSRVVSAYLLALAGATFGIGTQVYLTYRLPQFMDVARISSSIEQGLLIGSIFSMGILLTRLIVERFSAVSALRRTLLGTLAGAAGMNIAMFIFHVLFLNTPPRGGLIVLGCVLTAASYAVAGLLSSRLLRMALTFSALFLSITATWWLHVTWSGSITELTPFFRYDYNWTAWQVALTAAAVSAWIGIFGSLSDLRGQEP